MGNHTKRPDVYQVVTDQILELLDKGAVPWRNPWRGGALGWPKSMATKKQYRGINTFLLTILETTYYHRNRQGNRQG